MKTAKNPDRSQFLSSNPELVETVSNGLERDRSKMPVWDPIHASYGDDPPLLIGFDTEYRRDGDGNRLLSVQYYAHSLVTGAWRNIFYRPGGERYPLPGLISCVIRDGRALGRLKKWPRRIYLIGHFSLADLTTQIDFQRFKQQFDSVRRTLVSVKRPLKWRVWDENRHVHLVYITLRDSMLLAPHGKRSLRALGELVGVPKVELTEDELEHMDELLANDLERFESYALRDPEICVLYCLRMIQLNKELTGKPEIPVTLSGIGLNFLLRHWSEREIDRHAVLGTEVVTEEVWSKEQHRSIRKKETVPIAERHNMESFATNCYLGGLNVQCFFGAGARGIWTDWDLCGAYSTAMALIGLPNWRRIRSTRDLDEFQPHVMGFAHVRFRFPDGTRFPCLPVRTSNGLLFPLTGESMCCAPEVYQARRQGGQLEIVNGFVLPASFTERPFESFIQECTRRRKSHNKGSLEERFWKELANSLYGKLAQGTLEKRCFDSRKGRHVDLPKSRITNPFLAAFITSFIRALLGEILAALPPNRSVSNATTDGFLTNATDGEVRIATTGPLCQLFSQARLRISGDPAVLERKHCIAQPLGWRTRGQATLEAIDGQKLVLAKAGLKPPVDGEEEQNKWIVDTFINRTADTRQTIRMLRNLPEIWKHGGDLVEKEVTRRVNMEYDFKRRPVNPTTRAIAGCNHLFFETEAWNSVEEFRRCREAFEQFQGKTGIVLKTVEDLARFNDFRSVDVGAAGLKRSREDTSVTLAKRMFLRAYARSAWGLDTRQMSYAELARWLTENGYKTSKADVENAHRPSAKLVEHISPPTDAVERFVGLVQSRFPSFDGSRLTKP